MKTAKGYIGEEWIKMNDEYLQNRGFMVKGADTIITERVALKNTKEGIFYTSTVENENNKQPISFKLTSGKNNIFVFENPQHDFPKRIVYELISSDSLHAYIDDGNAGTKKRRDFYYKKSYWIAGKIFAASQIITVKLSIDVEDIQWPFIIN